MIQESISRCRRRTSAVRSDALKIGDYIIISGILPVDENNMLVSDDLDEQISQVFGNLHELLDACGLCYKHMMKIGIQLTDMRDLPHVDALMKKYFREPYPARTVVGVSSLGYHARIQIDGIAVDTRALEVLCDCEDEHECCSDQYCSF